MINGLTNCDLLTTIENPYAPPLKSAMLFEGQRVCSVADGDIFLIVLTKEAFEMDEVGIRSWNRGIT